MLTLARGALWALIPGEVVLLVLIFSGITLPPVVSGTLQGISLVALLVVVFVAYRLFRGHRRHADRRGAAVGTSHDLVPERVRRILGFDALGAVSLVLWAMRRRHGVPPRATAVSYSRAQTTPMGLFLFAMVVELIGVDLLFRHFGWPDQLRIAVLVIDGYSALVVLAIIAACITRPHVVSAGEVRIRYGAFFDLRIPREQIATVRRVNNMSEQGMVKVEGDELVVVVSSQTNLVIELTEPVTAVRPLGRPAEVRTIRCFADDPTAAIAALAADRDEPVPAPHVRQERSRH